MTNKLKEDNLPGANSSNTEKRKVSHTETGHAKNVANFEDLISLCTSYGAAYAPSNPLLSLAALNTLRTSAVNALKGVDDLLPAWVNAVTDREIVFNPFSKLITKVFNSFASSGASKEAIDDVLTIVRKIQGRRAKPIPSAADLLNTSGKSTEEIHKYISASQTSMDNRIENFYKLIQLLISQPIYSPNETELQTATLTALYNSMKSKNTTVINAYSALSNARISRDKVLYHPETGLVHIALEVKKYVKSVFGASHAHYKILSKIRYKGGTDLSNVVK